MSEQPIHELRKNGIVELPGIYDRKTLDKWNDLLTIEFEKQKNTNRSYVRIDKLHELGIFEEVLNKKFRSIILNIIPDPILLSFNVYETTPSDKPHVFSETFNGWHRDVNALPGLTTNDPNYLSFFIHLSDVDEKSGAFETVPASFERPAANGLDSIKVLGDIGKSYLWNRCLLHRATPNRSKTNRRMLKISLQHNYLQNELINSEELTSFRNDFLKTESTDEFLNFFLGKYHSVAPTSPQPYSLIDLPTTHFIPFETNSKVVISLFSMLKSVFFYIKRLKKVFGP